MKEFKCSCCGRDLSGVYYDIDVDDNLVCGHCIDRHYHRCRNCGKLMKENTGLCSECEDIVYTKDVNGYSTKPKPRFKNKYNIKNESIRYYGLEIEYSHLIPKLAKILFKEHYDNKMIYNKSDGSLSNGVEIVTNPCDYSTIKDLIVGMGSGFETVKQIKNHMQNAGIHIHVNKKSISPMSKIKLGYLLNYEWSIEDRRFMMYLSGRISTINTTVLGDDFCATGTQNSFRYIGNYNHQRHIALNFRNDHTLEFRIFKSTADVDTIISYIDMVNIMIDFCDNTGIKEININNLCRYIIDHSKNKILKDKAGEYFKDKSKTNVVNNYSISHLDIGSLGYDKLIDLYNLMCGVNSFGDIMVALARFEGGEQVDTPNSTSDYFRNTNLYKQIDNKLRSYLTDRILEKVGA